MQIFYEESTVKFHEFSTARFVYVAFDNKRSDLELGIITASLGGGHWHYAYWEIQVDSKLTWPPSKYTLYLYSIVYGVPYLYDSGSDLESISIYIYNSEPMLLPISCRHSLSMWGDDLMETRCWTTESDSGVPEEMFGWKESAGTCESLSGAVRVFNCIEHLVFCVEK